MPGNEDLNSSSFSELELVSLETSSSRRRTGPTQAARRKNDQEEYDDDPSADTIPPPLGVKLTGHRLLKITIVISFGITKGILTYAGESTSLTTLDWVSGSLLAVMLYWIGLYEEEGPKKWQWFFQDDLAPAISYRAKRFTGELLWLLFFLDGLVFIFSLSNFLGNLAVLLLARFFPHDVPIGAQWGVYLGFVVLGHILWYTAGALTRRTRTQIRTWQRAVRFVADYGPTPRAGQSGWSRVGITVRLFCGVALVVLSFMMYYYLVWAPLCVHPVVLLRPCVQGSVEGSCFEEERLDRHCTRGPIRLFSLYYYLFPRYGPYRIVID